MRLQVARGKVLSVVVMCAQWGRLPGLLGLTEWCTGRGPNILLRDSHTHMGNNEETCRDVVRSNSLPDLNPCGVL